MRNYTSKKSYYFAYLSLLLDFLKVDFIQSRVDLFVAFLEDIARVLEEEVSLVLSIDVSLLGNDFIEHQVQDSQ